jgi:hypothetical protein
MATRPFDRMVINPLERPASSDINQIGSNFHRSLMHLVNSLLLSRTSPGDSTGKPLFGSGTNPSGNAAFLGDAFTSIATSGMGVQLTAGTGFYYDAADTPSAIGGLSGIDDLSPLHPLVLAAAQALTVPAADATFGRIDIIEVKADRRLEQPSSRDTLNPSTGIFSAGTVNKVLAYYLDGRVGYVGPTTPSSTGIGYKSGAPSASPVAPSVTSGYAKIAEIDVAAGATSVAFRNIRDFRNLAAPGNQIVISGSLNFALTSASAIFGATLTHLCAPPGVRVGAFLAGGTNPPSMEFYVSAGGRQFANYKTVFTGTISPGGASPTTGALVLGSGTTPVLPSTMHSIAGSYLSGGTIIPPEFNLPDNQPVMWCSVSLTAMTGGAGGYYDLTFAIDIGAN